MTSLSVKYRPAEFEDVSSQKSVIKILQEQVRTKSFSNCIMLSGPSGCGKTTLARIMANKINMGKGTPIEIDAASNNSVEDVKRIVEEAQHRALDAEYKVYIIDECHALGTGAAGASNKAWQAFLKCIEEPPKYTVFFFCTTDPQKVPQTIQNRCQQFRLTRVNDESIFNRLKFICSSEMINASEEALHQIVKLAQGSMRQAITYLDKCKDYSTNISLNDVVEALGDYSYDVFFNLTNSLIDRNAKNIVSIIDNLFNKGSDLKVFIEQYADFLLDVSKYCIFKELSITKIPTSYESALKNITNLGGEETRYFNFLETQVLDIKTKIKGDPNVKTTIEIILLNIVYK